MLLYHIDLYVGVDQREGDKYHEVSIAVIYIFMVHNRK